MAEKKVMNQEIKGSLKFEEKVFEKMITHSLKGVDGLLIVESGFLSALTGKMNKSGGINVEVGETKIAVDMKIEVEFNKDIRIIYNEIRDKIYEEIKAYTGLELIELNVNVVDIKTSEEFEKELKKISTEKEETEKPEVKEMKEESRVD